MVTDKRNSFSSGTGNFYRVTGLQSYFMLSNVTELINADMKTI